MNSKQIIIAATLLLTIAARGGEPIVLPPQEGGLTHRGTTTDAQVFQINTPYVNQSNSYDTESGLQENPRIEVPLNVPKFDGTLGNLIAINITLDAFLESEIAVEANGILDPQFTHEAGFWSLDSLFGGQAGYPVVGLLQRPTNDPRGIAPNFYPIGSIGASCMGYPGDEDACYEWDYYDASSGSTVDVFLFEDENGPIYTLSDWVGLGFVPNFTIFIDNPGLSSQGDQFEFFVDNVDGASGYIDTYAYDGTLTVEYVYEVDQPDTDGDGVIDMLDNCTNVQNPAQTDTNGDNYGNACDPDLDNNGIVNTSDLGIFRAAFFSQGVTDTDFNADGVTNTVDLGVMKDFFFSVPGPSGLVP